VVIQSFSQIEELYSESMRKVMLTNCGTHLLLPGGGDDECEYYSRRIGETTAKAMSQTSTPVGWGTATQSYTEPEVRRRLYKPEELRTMAQDEMLVLVSRHLAMAVKTMPYDRDREVRKRAGLPFPHATVYATPAPPTGPSRMAPGTPGQLAGPGGNTGRVVNSAPDDDDDWPGYAPE
jgi:type IV secretion system protein VirD4